MLKQTTFNHISMLTTFTCYLGWRR